MNEIIKIEGLRKRFGDNEVLKGITTSVSVLAEVQKSLFIPL